MKKVYLHYYGASERHFEAPAWNGGPGGNAYFSVLFSSEGVLLTAQQHPNEAGFFPRRYFSPSLDTFECGRSAGVRPASRDRAGRTLCLPMYPALPEDVLEKIVSIAVSSRRS